MDIKKLTITPIQKGLPQIVSHNPTQASASLLMKERLAMKVSPYNKETTPRVFKKLPDWLKGFVNPKTLVSKERHFFTEI